MVEPNRWEDARSVIAGAPSAGAYERRRTSVRRRVGLVVGCMLVPVVIGGVLVVTGVPIPGGGRATGPSHEAAGLVLVGVGLVVEAFGLVRLLRDRTGLIWNSPLTALTFGQRRELLKAVRRDTGVAPERQDLAVFLARRLLRQRPVLLMIGGLAISASGEAMSGRVAQTVLAVLMVVSLVVCVPLVLRDERRARRWLHEHEHEHDAA